MRSFTLTLCFCLFWFLNHAQVKKVYLNDDLVKISEAEFEKNEPFQFYYLSFDLDTLIANVKVQRIEKGNITLTKLDSIKREISISANQNISPNDILIINYYPGPDRCRASAEKSYVRARYEKFSKKVEQLENVRQFFIYKSPEGTEDFGKINWIKDESDILQKTFFPIHYPCGSFVIIDKDGNFYLRKGEYDITTIIDLLENRKSTFANSD